MALSANELVRGPAYVTFGDVELGLTEEDGISWNVSDDQVDYTGGQSIVVIKTGRTRVAIEIKAKFSQLTLQKWGLLMGVASVPASGATSMTVAFNSTLQERALILTMPGDNSSTRVGSFTATAKIDGDTQFAKGVYSNVSVTFMLIGDPTTNQYGTIAQTASSTSVPAKSTYQKVVSDVETTIVDTATDVEITAEIQVTFNVAIRPDQLTGRNFKLFAADANAPISVTIAYGETSSATDRTKVKLTPASSLSTSTVYNFIINEDIMSFDNLRTASTVIMQFTTAAS